MKKTSICRIITFLILGLCLAPLSVMAQIDHMEPPFWWTGMEHPELQLMVHGKDLGLSEVIIRDKDIDIVKVDKAENTDYLFVTLDISKAPAGSFDISFLKENKKVAEYSYELKERKAKSAQRDGFNSSDVMYLIMPDRFANGDPSNDEVKGMKEKPNRPEPYGRHGGDIKGIADNLSYIKDMGFTAVWLNPVLENDMEQWSYHGYAATDFYKVDRRFGSNEDYKKLSEQASSMGIKMIMDMIFNHCGSLHWWMESPPFKDWINYYPDYKITNHRRTVNIDPYASEADKDGMIKGWFVPTMPDLNQENPFMAEYLIQNSIWWIEYVGLSGIRMDTYPYPEKHMMAEWNRRVLKEYPYFTIVGEEWSLNPVLVSYWQKDGLNKDSYNGFIPSMMDFPLQSAVSEALNEEEGFTTGLTRIYDALANDILYADPAKLVIFPDNHDMARFYMQLGMKPELYKLGITFFLTTRGIPQIFYGSEILMTHTKGNDHGLIRKDFPGGWQGDKINAFTGAGLHKEEAEMQNFFWTVLNWRRTKEVIHKGELMHFAPENKVYVYFRYNFDEKVMIILNKNSKETVLELDRFSEMLNGYSQAKDIITGKEISLKEGIRLSPVSPMILELR